MPKLKLTYFDINGGRAEVARLALVIGEVPFEDDRISFQQFGETRLSMPFGAVPIIEVDGEVLTQSSTISRYVGKLTNLYPEDPWQAAICDEVMDVIEDLDGQVFTQLPLTDEQKQESREGLASGALTMTLNRLEECLKARGGEYMADNRLTVADLKVFEWVRLLESGMLDHIPTELAEKEAPLLVAHAKKIGSHPKIVAYYKA
jgi:glutathione S-transferase